MIQEALQWYNLIFYVPILLGVVLIGTSVMGIGADTDIGMDSDVDADINNPIDTDNFEIETEGYGIFTKILGILGIGRCPISIVMFTAFLLFGITGLIFNALIPTIDVAGIPIKPWIAPISVGCAFCVTLIGTRFIALSVSTLMPQTETYNITPPHFVGKRGKVVISVSETFGQIHVVDGYGSLHKLNARSYGSKFPVSSGVFITEYKDGVYYVDKPKEELL